MWAKRQWLALCAVLLSGACSDARYDDADDSGTRAGDAAWREDGEIASDAGTSSQVDASTHGGDAQTSPADAAISVSPPDWAAPLLGQYGIRARFFERDAVGAPGKIEWLMLGRFAFDAASAQVTLTTELCQAVGTSTLIAGISSESGPLHPTDFPARVYKVQNDASGWSTDGAPLRIGFNAEPVVPCPVPGARVMADPNQNWNKDGLCTCPLDPSVLPDHARDCRVVDVDDDGAPAATVAYTNPALETRFHVLQYDASRFVRGTIDAAERHHDASYAAVQENVQLTCGDAPCAKQVVKICGSEVSPALVRPLGPPGDGQQYDCDDVLSHKDSLFGTDAFTFPGAGC